MESKAVTMALFPVYLLLLLALPLKDGLGLYTNNDNNNNSKLLAILNATSPAVDVVFHIDVVTGSKVKELPTTVSPLSLESIIRAEINGDWERGRLVLQLASQARTTELKHAIYEALWQELQQMKQIYDPLKVFEFYGELEQLSDVPPALLQKVYKEFVQRSAQLLSAPFHTDSLTAIFPLVEELLQRLTLSTLDYLRDILEALFNAVLALESTLSVAQRLGNFSGSLTQLTLANLQLLKRPELELDAEAHKALQHNLRKLLEKPAFGQVVDNALKQEVYAHLPEDERILYTAQKICLRNVTHENSYVYECPQTYLICTNHGDPKKAAYYVQRGHGDFNNTLQFAFYSAYWRNRYILMEPTNRTAPNAIKKNVYSRDAINWWHVIVQEDGLGVALYDAATSQSVLCGGNPEHWDGEEKHVYTRNADDFALYRRECIWSIEDCSDVA